MAKPPQFQKMSDSILTVLRYNSISYTQVVFSENIDFDFMMAMLLEVVVFIFPDRI
jgi:hypothetical protein